MRYLLIVCLFTFIAGCPDPQPQTTVPTQPAQPTGMKRNQDSLISTGHGVWADEERGKKNVFYHALYIQSEEKVTDFYVYEASLNLEQMTAYAIIHSVECTVLQYYPGDTTSEARELSVPVVRKIAVSDVHGAKVQQKLEYLLPWPYCIRFLIRFSWRDGVQPGIKVETEGKYEYRGIERREKLPMRGTVTTTVYQP